MPLFETIRADHERILELFEALNDAEGGDPNRLQDLADQLTGRLDAHTRAETELIYPLLSQDADDRLLMLDALEEHHVFDLILAEIRRSPPADERLPSKWHVLESNVSSHIDEEEEDVLPVIVEQLSEREAQERAREFDRHLSAWLTRRRAA